MSYRSHILLTAAVLALTFSGCTTDPYRNVNWDDVELTLQPGMTPEAVKTLLGEPSKVEEPDMDTAAGGIVTWVYRRKIPAGSWMAVTGVIEVPWVDPITGEMKSEKQPLYTPVNFMTVEEFHLHWRKGLLYQWQRFVRHERQYF